MIQPPSYFEDARLTASRMWDQLEADPHLAGPWHQLFKQVQSPRHVLSELLQNADDAGATEASVTIEESEFVFAHNGEDFKPDHFASLCRFGYSNKRALHTIGFRGVGFKSTFSLGSEVRLLTPTLAVAFNKQRFTEPVWLGRNGIPPRHTEVRVLIEDVHRKTELYKNLDEWLKSPASLLFFRSLRSLRIREREVRWESRGPGPIENSEWMGLTTEPHKQCLLIRSTEEIFPEDALEEIRSERMLSVEDDMEFPPCRVEIVLGLEGRLFVILPTGVKTSLPFACNAPFVQDPARLKIKDPETSPINRWLLGRLGRLGTQSMLSWIAREDLNLDLRCDAYDLLPNVDREDNSLEGVCALIVEESFDTTLKKTRFLLSDNELLKQWGECVALPETLLEVWSTEEASELFVDDGRSIMCRKIGSANRAKLIHWGCATQKDKSDILDVLELKHAPKPPPRRLLLLWEYLSGEISGYAYQSKRKAFRIFPVRGKDVLFSANEVIRIGEDNLLQSQSDWEFLAPYLLIIDQSWPRYLTTQRRESQERADTFTERQVGAAQSVFSALGQEKTSELSLVIQQVAKRFFAEDHSLTDVVKLTHIAAKLGATLSDDFLFVTRRGERGPAKNHIMVDVTNDLDCFVTKEWYDAHVIHDEYVAVFESCARAEWEFWISSGRSGLNSFVPLIETGTSIWGRPQITELLRARGLKGELTFPYAKSNFIIEDWDFASEHWLHWQTTARADLTFWSQLFARIIKQPKEFWVKAISARVMQVASNKAQRSITQDLLASSWIVKFRGLTCLQDTRGSCRLPAELLRRTGLTESFLEVEPFIRAEVDNETNRPLLIQLGVRDTPTGPERLLERLIALAGITSPPIYEVEKWYHRLDQMATRCSTDELDQIKTAFQTNKIILTEDRHWVRAGEVFIERAEEDAPGAAVVFSSVRNLSLWHKVGVKDRPTVELAIEWLKSLPSSQPLSPDELRRVRSLLPKHPERIWSECEHWLNLEGEWTSTLQLSYSLTMQSLVAWKHLFTETKKSTAEFQKLSVELCQQYPFSSLPTLGSSIEERFKETLFDLPPAQNKRWLSTLGSGLSRVRLEDRAETDRVRALAQRLADTQWQVAVGLETVPYIAGVPVGTSRPIDVLWKSALLYVEDRSIARMARAVAQELGRVFLRPEIVDAIKLCYDRSPEFVKEYLEENFKLDEVTQMFQGESCLNEESLAKSLGDTTVAVQETIEVRNDQQFSSETELLDASGDDQSERPDENESNVTSDNTHDELSRRKEPRPLKLGLIERFARERGYIKGEEDHYSHIDGSMIVKASGLPFPWEQYSPLGELTRCYWIKDHCIQEEPLQLPAEVWSLCEKSPEKYSLVLSDTDGSPREITGKTLCEMRANGNLSLHAATYRLVCEAS
jgi:hypothetical protein